MKNMKKKSHWLVLPDVMMPHWNMSGYTLISDMKKTRKMKKGKISKFGKYINYITTKKCEEVKIHSTNHPPLFSDR